jgi:hypothetical protein
MLRRMYRGLKRLGAVLLLAFAGCVACSGDDEPGTIAEGGGAGNVFEYRVQADDVAAFRAAGADALTDLQVCLQYPGLSDGAVLDSNPAQYTGRVAGQERADAFVACVETVPGMTATLTTTGPSPEGPDLAVTNQTATPSGNRWWVRTRPAPGDRTLDLMVQEVACASGQPAEGRIGPIVKYEADKITVTITVKNAEGFQSCPGNPDTPFTLMLDEAVGDRVIYDGRTSPPRTAQVIYFR